MKQLLRITRTLGKYNEEKEMIITSQKELEEAIEENARGNKPWRALKFGEEGWTSADFRFSEWDESNEVKFRLLNIDTAIAEFEKQKANIDHEIKKYKLLIEI